MTEETLWLPQSVPVFPLPEVVLLPGQVLPLHVFEPRYRTMVRDAVAGSQFIAVALLKPDYEPLYLTSFAPICDAVGVGRLIACKRRPDGCFDIHLAGTFRAEIRRETYQKPYRVARIRALSSRSLIDVESRRRAADALRDAIQSSHRLTGSIRRHLEAAISRCGCVGQAADLVAVAAGTPIPLRQSLLEETNPIRRARAVTEWLRNGHGLIDERSACHAAGATPQRARFAAGLN